MVTPANALLDDIDQVVFDEETIRQTVARLGAAISADYAGLNPLLVGSLTGVVIFMADLLRQITVPVSVDFMAVSHFASGQHAGSVRITKDLDLPITGIAGDQQAAGNTQGLSDQVEATSNEGRRQEAAIQTPSTARKVAVAAPSAANQGRVCEFM